MAFRGIQSTNLISNDVGFSDPLLILNKDSSLPTDVGWLGKIGPISYAGFVRDHETNSFWLIDSVELTPNSLNSINAGEITKGDLHVRTLTVDTIIGGGLSSTLSSLTDVDSGSASTGDLILYDGSTWSYVNLESEINTRITASQTSQSLIGLSDVGHTSDTIVNGDFLLYDSSTSKFGFVNFQNEVVSYADGRIASTLSGNVTIGGTLNANVTGNVTGNIINPNTGSTVLNASQPQYTLTGNVAGDLYGDVISPTQNIPIITTGPIEDTLTIHNAHVEKLKAPGSSGATIIDTTGYYTLQGQNIALTGTLFGDIGDTLANNPVLTVGTGNNDSQLVVHEGIVDELTATDSFTLPKGGAHQRPASPVEGMMWFNTTTKMFEGYDGTNWIQLIPSTYQLIP
jgi:hypothetical protein